MNLASKNVKNDYLEKKRIEENIYTKLILRYGILIFTFFLIIFFSFMAPRFFSGRNFLNIITSSCITGMFALGLTSVVCMADFDIAFASVGVFGGILYVLMVESSFGIPVAAILTILITAAIYILFAVCVLYINIPAFLTSIALLGIMSGVSAWITGGGLVYSYTPGFEKIGRGMIFGVIPSPVLPFLIVTIIMVYLIESTYLGRYIYSIGSSPDAAEYSGISVKKVKFTVFLICGVLVGITGIVLASKFGACGPSITSGYLFPSIITVYIGAVFFKEGTPNPMGTIIAAILISIMENGFLLMGVPLAGREILRGILLFTAVGMVSSMKKGGIPEIKMG